MISDLTCAGLCYKTYYEPGAFDQIIDAHGIYAGIKHYADHTVLAFRGSVTAEDWLRDFDAVMVNDLDLGNVENGFITGLREAFSAVIFPNLPLVITGHSLGAAHAVLFAGITRVKNPEWEVEVCLFGCPRPGGSKLKEIFDSIPCNSYRNGNDPITHLPPALPGFPYQHVGELIQIQCIAPAPQLALSDHHIQQYIAALALKDA